MSIVRSADSLNLIRAAYEGNGELKLTSLHIRAGQKTMLEELARKSGESQAAVIRAILDEWCEHKLSEGS